MRAAGLPSDLSQGHWRELVRPPSFIEPILYLTRDRQLHRQLTRHDHRLVCFAVYGSIQARELVSKVTAIWWPTATFVARALDHTIANMFFIPNGIWAGARISVGYYIWKSMVASSLGNIVGGGLFVGTAYLYLYLTGEGRVEVSFGLGAEETAVEGGAGPMRVRSKKNGGESSGSDEGNVIEGVAPEAANGGAMAARQRSGGAGAQMMSGIGKELSDDSEWAKFRIERMAQQGSGSEKV